MPSAPPLDPAPVPTIATLPLVRVEPEPEVTMADAIDNRINLLLKHIHRNVLVERRKGCLFAHFMFTGTERDVPFNMPVEFRVPYVVGLNHWPNCGEHKRDFMKQPEVIQSIKQFLQAQKIEVDTGMMVLKEHGYPHGVDFPVMRYSLKWTRDSPAQWTPFPLPPQASAPETGSVLSSN
jgi:hypothetical protein